MENLTVVYMLQGKTNLEEPVDNLVFWKILLLLPLFDNSALEIASVSIIHNDTETLLLNKRLFIRNNIWVTHCFQDMDFVESFFLLLSVELRYVNNLVNGLI